MAGAAAASVFVVLGAGYCYHRSVLRAKGCEDVEYPQVGGVKFTKISRTRYVDIFA